VASLPLPPVLEYLNGVFVALNVVHSFLLSQHIQVSHNCCAAPVSSFGKAPCVLFWGDNTDVKLDIPLRVYSIPLYSWG
jgi:hypothetical protein